MCTTYLLTKMCLNNIVTTTSNLTVVWFEYGCCLLKGSSKLKDKSHLNKNGNSSQVVQVWKECECSNLE